MGKWMLLLLLSATMFLGEGCQTTDNPREGGLFSYDPQAYDRRLEERRQRLDQAKQEQAAEQQRTSQLEAEAADKRAQRDALAADLAALDSDIARLETRIAQAKSDSQAVGKAAVEDKHQAQGRKKGTGPGQERLVRQCGGPQAGDRRA